MEVYVLRHGIAEDVSSGMRDEDRKLTREGEEKLRAVLKAAAGANLAPGLIITSPLVRAVQTAEIAAKQLGYTGDLVRTRALVPEADPSEIWTELRTHRKEQQILLASHNPLCARLAGYLLGLPALDVEFRKAALLRVDIASFGPAPRGTLQWFLTPKLA